MGRELKVQGKHSCLRKRQIDIKNPNSRLRARFRLGAQGCGEQLVTRAACGRMGLCRTVGYRPSWKKCGATSHGVSAVGKHREVGTGAWLTLSFSFFFQSRTPSSQK